MADRTNVAGLDVATILYRFVEDEALPGSGVESAQFWEGLASIIAELSPVNRRLLERRAELQARIDDYHRSSPGTPDAASYKEFLREIGYLVEEPADFTIGTSGVDSEITSQAGPQLVVPLLNARFATNAANARWGSLYDALYGTDAIPDVGDLTRNGGGYNEARGARVIALGRSFLDASAPLDQGSHADATSYAIDEGGLAVTMPDGSVRRLADPAQLAGYSGDREAPASVLLVQNGLHIEIQVDPSDRIGRSDAAGVKDIVLEAAVTTIMDLEDSVAAVDAEDKTLGYRNWLRLNQGTLTERVRKGGTTFTRTMHEDRVYTTPQGEPLALHGRALMFIREVGHLMTTDAVLDPDGNEVPEGILDALMCGLGSVHDLRGDGTLRNSRTGSAYIVKPKMHGPEEVAFTDELFGRTEQVLGLAPLTLKLGIMDEERRTTVNLKACIAAAKDRVVFINTGFLDRTGDEIHTSLHAGPFVRKSDMKSQRFLPAYEDHNVDTGLAAGFQHRAQIGKGMWAMPNLMAAMLEQKIAHPKAGATTAWVPSPTAATLHALHYHQVDVFAVQDQLRNRPATGVDPILEIPLAPNPDWTREERRDELDNNVQSILGYVVRWVDQGIGCSTVPDIRNVGLMEDRATLRISSQLLANWLAHGIISEDDLAESMQRISEVVDDQNTADPLYEPLIGPQGPGLAFQAARELVVQGAKSPSGYTEPILHRIRRAKKAAATGAPLAQTSR
jgi:malate synthase